jgi:L-threonylcarbamoyladenylate synthase
VNPDIETAVRVLKKGGLVAFPTETVYGLGADAENAEAVRRIFRVKGRPEGHPLIVHLADARDADGWVVSVTPLARRLAARFWPGPLTLVLPRAPRVPDAVTGGQDTVALRVPAHPLALDLLRAFGGGVAAPSANRFGRVSPTTAAHVREDLGADIDLVLDGGPCAVGVESTILDLSGREPALLRPGGAAREALEAEAGRAIPPREGGPVRAPGTLPSHYAPDAIVELARRPEFAARAAGHLAAGRRVAVLAAERPAGLPEAALLIELPANPAEAARRLYDALREADRRGCDVVLVELPAETGIGAAVSDRLRRAAAAGGGRDAFHVQGST